MEHYLKREIDYRQAVIADAYDELPFWSAAFGLLLFRELPMIRSGEVLDIGSGTGFPLTLLAARLGPQVKVTGIDPWESAHARAQARIAAYGLENATAMHGDTRLLPFENDRFDLATANLVINNLDQVPTMFAECMRVLRPGGRLCITSNVLGTFQEIYGLLMQAMAQLGAGESLYALTQHAAARRSPLQVADLFQAAGFEAYRAQEADHYPRWSCGAAFLNDPLIVMGFLPGWRGLVPSHLQAGVFAFVERSLDAMADAQGSVTLTVPMIYAEGRKPA